MAVEIEMGIEPKLVKFLNIEEWTIEPDACAGKFFLQVSSIFILTAPNNKKRRSIICLQVPVNNGFYIVLRFESCYHQVIVIFFQFVFAERRFIGLVKCNGSIRNVAGSAVVFFRDIRFSNSDTGNQVMAMFNSPFFRVAQKPLYES